MLKNKMKLSNNGEKETPPVSSSGIHQPDTENKLNHPANYTLKDNQLVVVEDNGC
jgi:hypothetical protein